MHKIKSVLKKKLWERISTCFLLMNLLILKQRKRSSSTSHLCRMLR